MSQFSLLRTRRFLPLFCTQSLGALNDNLFKNALVIFIAFALADKTTINSSVLVIIAGGLFILPFFLFSATAGQIADKYEKAMLIRRIKLAEIVIMCLAATGFLLQDVYVLLFVLFLMGTQSTFFGPLKYGILPQHLCVEELTGGNGLIQMATYLAILLGTIIGGLMIALGSIGPLLVSIAVIAVALSGWYVSRRIPLAEASDNKLVIDWNMFVQTWSIIRYVVKQKELFIIIVAISWFWFIGATFLSLVPGYTRDVLQGNEIVATLLLTAFSIGIGSGSLICERLSRGRIELGLIPIGIIGLSIFSFDLFLLGIPDEGFSSIIGYWRTLFDMMCIGFFGGVYIVPLYAMVQHRSAPEHRARVIAATNILNALFMVCSAVMTVFLIQVNVSIPTIFLIVACMNGLVAVTLFWRHREFLAGFNFLLTSWLNKQQ